MNFKNIKKISMLALMLTTAAVSAFTGCGRADSVSLEDLYNANTTSAILQNHSSIYEEFTYHENLDDEVTFYTSYCYSESDDGTSVYQADGNDAADTSSEDNFHYCIVDNIEYFLDNSQQMVIYPLTAQYTEDFKSNSFTVSINNSEVLDTTVKDGSDIIFTTTAQASDIYSSDTLESLASLCDDTISEIKTVYTADADTLLISNVKMYYISESGTEYLFSEENVTYDTTEPDVSFASAYIDSDDTRSVTVVEKTDAGDTTNTYSIPASVIPDFSCFVSYHGYTMYNDASGLDPYEGEKAAADGKYQNITLYAIESDTSSDDAASETVTE